MNESVLYLNPPANFSPSIEVVACFIKCKNHILFLKRQVDKSEGNTWCVPGGKREKEETKLYAMQREIQEETGLNLGIDHIKYCHATYVRYPNFEFDYHLFRSDLTDRPMITLNQEEHQAFRWMTLSETEQYPLTPGVDEALRLLFAQEPFILG
jgi:8-oxo-dGTP pyrophosphatase MutT (NUDIX family)